MVPVSEIDEEIGVGASAVGLAPAGTAVHDGAGHCLPSRRGVSVRVLGGGQIDAPPQQVLLDGCPPPRFAREPRHAEDFGLWEPAEDRAHDVTGQPRPVPPFHRRRERSVHSGTTGGGDGYMTRRGLACMFRSIEIFFPLRADQLQQLP